MKTQKQGLRIEKERENTEQNTDVKKWKSIDSEQIQVSRGKRTTEFRAKIGSKRGARNNTRGKEQKQVSRQKNTHSNHI